MGLDAIDLILKWVPTIEYWNESLRWREGQRWIMVDTNML
jgi:hypothetical protein